jgi:hypothetical protein
MRRWAVLHVQRHPDGERPHRRAQWPLDRYGRSDRKQNRVKRQRPDHSSARHQSVEIRRKPQRVRGGDPCARHSNPVS